jgi:hypothetical protein
MAESDSTTKPPEKPATGIPTEFFQAMMRLEAQDNPHVVAQVWKELKAHRQAVKAGRWKPLR